MKKLISLFSLSLCCFAASAQPTSIGGITPGTTMLEELRGLSKNPDSITGDSRTTNGLQQLAILKQPDDIRVVVRLQNGVVYETAVDLTAVLRQALTAKHGEPQITVGIISTANCQNGFGATFKRYEGTKSQFWPVKDGVQGGIESSAPECGEYVSERFVLRHISTVEAIKEKEGA